MISHFGKIASSYIIGFFIILFSFSSKSMFGQLFHKELVDKGLSFEQIVNQTTAHYQKLSTKKVMDTNNFRDGLNQIVKIHREIIGR